MNYLVLITLFCLIKSSLGDNLKIIGGADAEDGQFPYIVSIRGPEDTHLCGGSIVNSEWILTAAHCLYGRNHTIVTDTIHISQGGSKYDIEKWIPHEEFDLWTSPLNDVGLIKVSTPIVLEDVEIIELETEDVGEVDAVVAGWGLFQQGDLPDTLQYLNLTTITFEKCQDLWNVDEFLVESNICTLTVEGQGVCSGDSGSPLVEWLTGKQIGIVSRGDPCAKGVPDIFTKVSYFMDWINDKIK